jgi:hypothetical protein
MEDVSTIRDRIMDIEQKMNALNEQIKLITQISMSDEDVVESYCDDNAPCTDQLRTLLSRMDILRSNRDDCENALRLHGIFVPSRSDD